MLPHWHNILIKKIDISADWHTTLENTATEGEYYIQGSNYFGGLLD